MNDKQELSRKGQCYWLTCSLGNSDIFAATCSYKQGLGVGSHFIGEINDLFTETVTLQLYKADSSSQNKISNSDRFSTV